MRHTLRVNTRLDLPTPWAAQSRLSHSTDNSLDLPAPVLAEWSCNSRGLKVICMVVAAVIHTASVVVPLHDQSHTTAMQGARAVVPEAGPWLSLILDARSVVTDGQSFTLVSVNVLFLFFSLYIRLC